MLRDEIESLKAELALLRDKTPLPLKINDPYLMLSETHYSKHSQSKGNNLISYYYLFSFYN